jgi:hypothetical protein
VIAFVAALLVQSGEWEELGAICREVVLIETPYDTDEAEDRRLRWRIARQFRGKTDVLSNALRDVLLSALPRPHIRGNHTPPGEVAYVGSPGMSWDDLPEEGMGESFLPFADDVPERILRNFPASRPLWLRRRMKAVLSALNRGEARPEFDAPTEGERSILQREVARLGDDNLDVREEAQERLVTIGETSLYRRDAVVTFLLDEVARATDLEVRSRLLAILDRL